MASSDDILKKYKNYTPEIVEFDELTDCGSHVSQSKHSMDNEPLHYESSVKSLDGDLLEKYKDYVPEAEAYDEDVDGGIMQVREKHLDTKDELREKFLERLKSKSSGKTAR